MSGIMSMLLGAVSSAVAAADEFFNRVTLLLNTSSTNGAQNNTFLDSSSNNFTITRNGNTTQGTFTPFSQTGWSAFFNRTNYQNIQVASSADFDMGSGAGNFTIEFWANFNSLPGGSNFHWLMQGNNQGGIFLFGTSPNIYWRNAADQDLATSVDAGITVGVWYHFAFVRSSSTYSIYKNGTLLTSGTGTPSASANQQLFIGTPNSYSGGLDGYISNFRFTRSAVYTSAFTVTTSPLTTTSQSVSSSDVKLLTLQSNRFVDNSTQNTKTILFGDNGSNLGTRFIQAFSPFAPTAAYDAAVVGGSGYFDGTGDYLTLASDAAFSFGTSDFSEEFWIYLTTTPSTFQRPLQYSDDRDNIVVESGNFNFFDGSASTISAATTGQWFHLCVTRVGGTLRGFVNGRLGFTRSGTYNSGTRSLALGATSGGSNPLGGYTSNYRIVKGGIPSAYSTSSTTVGAQIFTPPTAPFTGSESLTAGSVSLLCNFTNAGIFDSTAKNDLETVGNAQVSTTQAKFGTTSMSFDGTGDQLLLPYRPPLDLASGDWTIEGWIYLNSVSPVTQGVITLFNGNAVSGSNIQYIVRVNTSNLVIEAYISTTASTITFSGITTGTWNHFAFVRSGTTMMGFLNGTKSGTTPTLASNLNTSTTWVTSIGRYTSGGTNYDLNGYIDDLRITKGYARYTANFTAPTAAFPVQ
jgi:hypothetical protein